MKIVIIDYGMGNAQNVKNALTFLKYSSEIVSDTQSIENADVVIFPGVGAFGEGMSELRKRNLIKPITNHINENKPFLGLCLGMHLLFDVSMEHGEHQGLGILKGKVIRFSDELNLKIPHMGWNSLKITKNDPVFKDIKNNSYVYFVHSYYAVPKDKKIIAAATEYGKDFCSMIIKDNIYAMQFHPEKSQEIGLKMLSNFLERF